MGTLVGHVAPGSVFLLIGLWHLFNNTKLYALKGSKYRSQPWFPATFGRHLELYLIMGGSASSVFMELIGGPSRHTPFDPDGTIPSNHLHNFEHSSISLLIFVCAATALSFDYLPPAFLHRHVVDANEKILHLVAAMAFTQELLLFHLHSTDHVGVEGQYHWLLQLVIATSLATTFLVIAWPESFAVSYARSLSVFFQGVWFIHLGIMLYTPSLTPKGCFIKIDDARKIVVCDGSESLHRAKSLVNIGFSWFLIGLAIFAVSFYLLVMWVYAVDYEYTQVADQDDAEAHRMGKFAGETTRLENFDMNKL